MWICAGKNESSSDTVQHVFLSYSDLLKLCLPQTFLQADPASSCQKLPELAFSGVIFYKRCALHLDSAFVWKLPAGCLTEGGGAFTGRLQVYRLEAEWKSYTARTVIRVEPDSAPG